MVGTGYHMSCKPPVDLGISLGEGRFKCSWTACPRWIPGEDRGKAVNGEWYCESEKGWIGSIRELKMESPVMITRDEYTTIPGCKESFQSPKIFTVGKCRLFKDKYSIGDHLICTD